MIKNNELSEIKELIEKGFDLELMSFELDIPLEDLIQLKKDIETSKKIKLANSKNPMEQVRERYNKLFFANYKKEVKIPKKLTMQQIELVNSVTTTIDKEIKEMKGLSKKEKRKNVNSILMLLKQIKDFNLSIEQAEKLYNLMQSSELEHLNLSIEDKMDYYVKINRDRIAKKFAKAIDYAHLQTSDFEELKALERKITSKMEKSNPIFIGGIRTNIYNKMSKIQQQIISERIRNDVPTSISAIINDIVIGKLDVQNANEIINSEAKKRVESKPKTRFSLTEEQERRQILIQIRTVLSDRAEQYRIENPEVAIMQIQKLCGGELEQSIRVVVKNLIGQKEFERAKQICNKYALDEEKVTPVFITRLKKEIRNKEISDTVLRGIAANGSLEEGIAFYNLIENGLKTGNVKPETISLGKSQDGLRTITLADVWLERERIK